MSNVLDKVKPDEAVKAIDEILSSLGWNLMKEYLKADAQKAVMDFGNNPNMSEQEIHYRRGTIYATNNFCSLPDKLRMFYENQTRLPEVK